MKEWVGLFVKISLTNSIIATLINYFRTIDFKDCFINSNCFIKLMDQIMIKFKSLATTNQMMSLLVEVVIYYQTMSL